MYSPEDFFAPGKSLEDIALLQMSDIRRHLGVYGDSVDSFIELDTEQDNPDIYSYIIILSDLLCEGMSKELDTNICYNAFCFAYNVGKMILGDEIQLGSMDYLLDGDRRALRESLMSEVEEYLNTHSVWRVMIDEHLLSNEQSEESEMLSRTTAAITFMHIENQYARNHLLSEFQHSGLPITE